MNRPIKIQSIILISVIETDFEENDFSAQKKNQAFQFNKKNTTMCHDPKVFAKGMESRKSL